MKTVDLRKRGDAVPLVDELATVELDLWAQERGLTKMRVNVLGL
jgi:formate dehydrogenase maturation protein FdhE